MLTTTVPLDLYGPSNVSTVPLLSARQLALLAPLVNIAGLPSMDLLTVKSVIVISPRVTSVTVDLTPLSLSSPE